LFFAWHVLWPHGWNPTAALGAIDWPTLAIGILGALALFRFKIGVIPVILGCGAAGLIAALALPP